MVPKPDLIRTYPKQKTFQNIRKFPIVSSLLFDLFPWRKQCLTWKESTWTKYGSIPKIYKSIRACVGMNVLLNTIQAVAQVFIISSLGILIGKWGILGQEKSKVLARVSRFAEGELEDFEREKKWMHAHFFSSSSMCYCLPLWSWRQPKSWSPRYITPFRQDKIGKIFLQWWPLLLFSTLNLFMGYAFALLFKRIVQIPRNFEVSF